MSGSECLVKERRIENESVKMRKQTNFPGKHSRRLVQHHLTGHDCWKEGTVYFYSWLVPLSH